MSKYTFNSTQPSMVPNYLGSANTINSCVELFFRCWVLINVYLWYEFSVWADADTWFERQQQEEEMQRIQSENRAAMEAAEELHRKKMAQDREGEKDEDIVTVDDPMARVEAEVLKQNSS